MSAQQRLWSDWADAQADWSLRWAHMPFCWFCRVAAHIPKMDLTVATYTQLCLLAHILNEPPHDKTNIMACVPSETQISLGIRPVWSESSLSAWRNLGSLATHWTHSEDSDQSGRMPRLIWVFAGRIVILLVLSWGGSNMGVKHIGPSVLRSQIAFFLPIFPPRTITLSSPYLAFWRMACKSSTTVTVISLSVFSMS